MDNMERMRNLLNSIDGKRAESPLYESDSLVEGDYDSINSLLDTIERFTDALGREDENTARDIKSDILGFANKNWNTGMLVPGLKRHLTDLEDLIEQSDFESLVGEELVGEVMDAIYEFNTGSHLNELSKHTLGSYADKAMDSKRQANKDACASKDARGFAKNINKANKRQIGLKHAINRLGEDQVNELSKKTLTKYAKNAKSSANDIASSALHAHDIGDLDKEQKIGSKLKTRLKGMDRAKDRLSEAHDKVINALKKSLNENKKCSSKK